MSIIIIQFPQLFICKDISKGLYFVEKKSF